MEKNCMICGKTYKYCPDCEKVESYKDVVDSPVCYSIYLTVIEHRDKVIDSNKAVDKLKDVKMTKDNLNKFELRDVIKNMILDIYNNATQEESIDVTDSENTVKDETDSEKIVTVSRKRKK